MLEHLLFLVYLLVLFILQVAWQIVQDSLPSSNSQDDSIRGQRGQGSQEIGQASTTREQEQDDQKGVMFYEYDLIFHYLLASLRREDGANSVT